VRGHLGLMLFSGDDGEKRLSALSGGEAARLVFSRLALEQPNVLVLDEPTNHLDLESIEALVAGLQNYDGTLILVSHDRWFVQPARHARRRDQPDGIRDYHGTYEEYVHACGDDHLDADAVVLKAKRGSRSGSSTCQFHLLVRVEGIDRFAVRDWCTSDARTLLLRPGEERTEGITWDGRVAAPSDPAGVAAARVPIVRLAPGVYEVRAAAGAVAVSEPMLVEVLPDQ
jgi:hypothetical protein